MQQYSWMTWEKLLMVCVFRDYVPLRFDSQFFVFLKLKNSDTLAASGSLPSIVLTRLHARGVSHRQLLRNFGMITASGPNFLCMIFPLSLVLNQKNCVLESIFFQTNSTALSLLHSRSEEHCKLSFCTSLSMVKLFL